MDIFFIIIALIQGITEFMPVSSSAHTAIFLNNLEDDSILMIIVMAHIGSLLAIIFYNWRDCFHLMVGIGHHCQGKLYTKEAIFVRILFIASLPLFVVGAGVSILFGGSLYNGMTLIAWTSILLGLCIYFMDHYSGLLSRCMVLNVDVPGWKEFLVMGFFQTLAIIPGASRSGMVFLGARAMGFDKERSLRFVFLLSIPALFAVTFFGVYNFFQTDFNVGNLVSLGIIDVDRKILEDAQALFYYKLEILLYIMLLSFVFSLSFLYFFYFWVKTFSMDIFIYYRILLGCSLIYVFG